MATDISDKFSPIRKGLLELIVLKIVHKNKVYAADILKQLSITEFATQEGTLYPLLSRLRREGALEYQWVESSSGPPRKYYSLTEEGKKQLKILEEYWEKINGIINKLG